MNPHVVSHIALKSNRVFINIYYISCHQVAQEIKYAKNLYDEKAQTLAEDDSSDEEDF